MSHDVSLAERLGAADAADRVAAIAALVEQGRADADELDALADCLGHDRKAVQRPAAEAFAALGARGVPVAVVLDRALGSAVPRRRWGAAFALSLMGAPPARILPVVLDTLGADDGDMRWAAAAIVRRMRDRAGVIDGIRQLLRDGNGAQRKMALYCLRDLDARSPDVEQAVVAALGDVEWSVRLAAVATLARLATDRARAAEHLLASLDAGDERVRRAAAAALGVLGEQSPRILAGLRDASAAGDPALTRAAAAALRQLGG